MNVPELLKAFSSLLWPVVAIVILIRFRTPIDALLDSTKSRKVVLKIGGNEVTLDEATQQQSAVVSELQQQLIELKDQVSKIQNQATRTENSASLNFVEMPNSPETTQICQPCPVQSILWVDDVPKNNSYLIEMLQQRNIKVVQALSTAEGLSVLGRQKFDRIISDMGRHEGKRFNPEAGLDFVKAAREIDSEVPIIIYSNMRSVEAKKHTLIEAGATEMTSGSTNLLKALNL